MAGDLLVAQAMSRLALIGLGQLANELEAAGRSGYGVRTQCGRAGNLTCKDRGWSNPSCVVEAV